MANILPMDKQILIVGALAEGMSIRAVERLTQVHRDTIMRLGIRIGLGCERLMNQTMRDLPCERLEVDEIWGFIGKKQRHLVETDDPQKGDVWTFIAVDADTKLVPCFKVGKRTLEHATEFITDVAGRMKNRIQLSSDGLTAYVAAVEKGFGCDVDYGQIIKTFGNPADTAIAERKYSASELLSTDRKVIMGNPDVWKISTSYVESQNLTVRMHMRRLTRLTNAFSKKLDNFKAAVGLHFAYYNFVKRHGSLRMTPAMAAGVAKSFWSTAELIERAK